MAVATNDKKWNSHHGVQVIAARVNVKSLAAEAAIIREEAARHKLTGEHKESLHRHRRGRLRREARYAQLAYAFLRGRKYREVEQKVRYGNEPNRITLAKKISRFQYTDEVTVGRWLARTA